MADGGHTFVKKTFHKPTYCHHCSDLLWGLIGQGYICEVCNFIIHERCVTSVVTPCSGIAPCIIKNPVAHCWSEPTHHKRKFCTVCRKRLDETPAVHCLICEYFAHIECQDFAVPDCTENATYVPGKELLNVKHQHHWREGNLPPTSKCAYCKKTCWSSECLTGYRCEWCGITTHGGCRMYLPTECNFGILQPIYLPPHSVSIPRTEVPIEAIIGVQVKSKTTLVRDYSCPNIICDPASEMTALTTKIMQSGAVDRQISTRELTLKEILYIERKRREQSKQNFLLSATPSPTSSLNTSTAKFTTTTITTTTTTTTGTESLAISSRRMSDMADEQDDSAVQLITVSNSQISTNKSPTCSTASPVPMGYLEKYTKVPQRKRQISNTDEDEDDEAIAIVADDEDVGVCVGNYSDEYDNCDVDLRPYTIHSNGHKQKDGKNGQKSKKNGRGRIHVPKQIDYETSDTGGEMTTTTDDIDSSMNLISNLSLNSSSHNNSNISIEQRLPAIPISEHGITKTTPILSQTDHGNNSSDISSSVSPVPPLQAHLLAPVARSRSFQEPGVKNRSRKSSPLSRHKKYARFFQRRRSKHKNKTNVQNKSNFSLESYTRNISITIQDEDGNYQPYDDNFCPLNVGEHLKHDDDKSEEECFDYDHYLDDRPHSCGSLESPSLSVSAGLSDDTAADISGSDNEHLFGRLLKRVQRLSLGWRKPRYQKRRARSISEEFSSGDTPRFKDEESTSKVDPLHAGNTASCSSAGSTHYRPETTSHKSDKSDKDKERKEKEREEKDIEMIKVFDGNTSFRRQLYRVIVVPRTYTLEQLLTTALRAFHISCDPSAFYLTDLYAPAGMEDTPLLDPNPVQSLTHIEGKRPAIYLRFHDKDKGYVRVYPGKLQCSLEEPYVSVPVDNNTVIKDLIRDALDKFGLHDNQIQDFRCSEVLLDRGVTERILSWNEKPWDIMKQLGKDSIRQMELMRFYMQHKQDPHGPNIALFVGNLPPGLSQRNYEQILMKYVTDENKFTSIGPIYYEYGSVVLTYEDAQKAVRAFYNLRETIIEDKKLLVMILPNIEPSMVPPDSRPLLVFVNVKSGGCQGLELISSFRKLLNPYQVFDLDNGGPLPGLYVFRQIANYKILVCGGDGTIGWVLQCLDNVGQDSECSSPPCAIVPLGTGNDLARVLCWGSGYTGGEDPLNLLRDVIEAEEIRLDRWTVVFHPEDKPEEPALKAPSNTTGGGAQNEDNSQIFVMNNYFGIGIDADLCLDFHNAREENPNKFNSRLHNKGYYVKMGLRKIVGRKTVKDLHKELRLEVDGKVVELPPVEGIIILNILSWGSGANPWGPDKDDNFTTPNHYDGVLEIVGVTGVVHLGQIQSGIRTAMRIAQGGHIKIHLFSDMPVQVDGEPWVQSPGDVVVLKSALKATMLKKTKSKRRLTEPHISPAVLSLSSTASAAAITSSGATAAAVGQQLPVPENGDRDNEATTSGT